jgi:hypothetical protein
MYFKKLTNPKSFFKFQYDWVFVDGACPGNGTPNARVNSYFAVLRIRIRDPLLFDPWIRDPE